MDATRWTAVLVPLLLVLARGAQATPQTIFDSTTQTADATDSINTNGALAASFVTPAYTGVVYSLGLELSCTNCVGSTRQFKVELLTNTGTNIPGTNRVIADQPGTTLWTTTIGDNVLNNTGVQLYTLATPFGATALSPNTAYWVELVDSPVVQGPNTLHTRVFWELMTGGGGTGVVGEYLTDTGLDTTTNCTPVGALACSFRNYSASGSGITIPARARNRAFGMDIQYIPEPGSVALLAPAVFALALRRQRRPRH
jgi:hypothetical protein